MKLLRRNTRVFEYLPWTGEETDLDENGQHTGEFYPVYGDPVEYRGNISSPSGKVNQTFYGQDLRYTHTLVMDKSDTDISETGLIRWNEGIYEIVAIRRSLNGLSAALRLQTANRAVVDDEQQDP